VKPSLFIITCFLLANQLAAQSMISGTVRDNKGRPLAGVSIALKDAYDGATSDSSGRYAFKSGDNGEKIIQVTSIGYLPVETKLQLSGSPVSHDFVLREAQNELKAVVITAGTFEASDSKRTTVLTSIDIVTTASANADVTSAIRTLPGAQQVGESEGLFVRGGTAGESKVFIDGTLVNNFFFSSVPDIASRGRFSPFLFKGTIFSSGGYSAQYGQALSSVLILESIDLPESSSASVSITTVGLSGGYQQLSKNRKSSWGGSYNFTNLLPYFKVVTQEPDYFDLPSFHNADFNYRLKTSKTGILKFYGYYNNSRVGLRRPDIDSLLLKDAFSVKNDNYYGNLSWKEKLGEHWKMNLGLAYSSNSDDIFNELQNEVNRKEKIPEYPFKAKSFSVNAVSELAVVKAVFERKLKGLTAFRFGGEYFLMKDESRFSNDSIRSTTVITDRLKAGFAEVDVYITNDLAAKIGGRVEHSSLISKANVAPRVSVAYKLADAGQASLAYGIFYQRPETNFFTRAYRFNQLNYTKATHYIINYQKVSRDYTLRVEGFHKKYEDLLKAIPIRNSNDSLNNAGYGRASGFEVFWRDRKTFKHVDYWLSYSYLDTKRDYLNYPTAIVPNFAAKHTASLVLKKFVTSLKTQFNASYTFATGRPYYNIRYDGAQNKYRLFDQGKTINYNNLSFSVNYLPRINKTGPGRFTVFVFSITNVLGSKQVFGYNYSYNGSTKEAITPPARRFIFLGCFLSFGVDRSEDAINSNL
jgi:vitamin B12 transporter